MAQRRIRIRALIVAVATSSVIALALSAVQVYRFIAQPPTSGPGSSALVAAQPSTPAPPPAAPVAEIAPSFVEQFDATPALLRPIRGGDWSTSDGALRLQRCDIRATQGNGNIAVLEIQVPPAYQLETRASVLPTDDTWDDFSVIFDYADERNYGYVSLNESNDAITSGIFRVTNGLPRELADIAPLPPGQPRLVSVLRASDGAIIVQVDGLEAARAAAIDVPIGLVGFGSRNNDAVFDDVTVRPL